MPHDRLDLADPAPLRGFPGGPSLGLGLCRGADVGALAARAEEAGFAALWLPPDALAEAAAVTRRLVLVAGLEVGVDADAEAVLPDPAGLGGRLAYAVRVVDPPPPARACRKAVGRVLRTIRAAARQAGAPLLIRGSCHASLECIAELADGWVYDRARTDCLAALLGEWRRVAAGKPFVQMVPEGPGLEQRVKTLLGVGVAHVAITLSAGAGRPELWRLGNHFRR